MSEAEEETQEVAQWNSFGLDPRILAGIAALGNVLRSRKTKILSASKEKRDNAF